MSPDELDSLERSQLALLAEIRVDQLKTKRLRHEVGKRRKSIALKAAVASVLNAIQEAREPIATVGMPGFLPAAIAPIPFTALAFVIGGPWLGWFVGALLLATSIVMFCLPTDSLLSAWRQTADRELSHDKDTSDQLTATLGSMQSRLLQMRLQAAEIASQLKSARDSQERRCQSLLQQGWKEMRGEEFECYLAEIFHALGYGVEQTGKSGDQGVDLIVHHQGRRIAIQAKGYGDSVSNAAVQQAFTGRAFYECDACAVITNSRFTSSAIEVASRTKCLLIHEGNFQDFVFGRVDFFV